MTIDTHEILEKKRLLAKEFIDAKLITPFNMAVFFFGQQRAIQYANNTQEPCFWIQATDSPPNWYAADFNATEMADKRKNWLTYHARKTEGILSLLLCCKGMPFRVTDNNGHEFKEYGIYKAATCILKSWEFDPKDEERAATNTEKFFVLQHLPKVLFVEMQTPMIKQYPGLPKNWFPVRPQTRIWMLDSDGQIDIARKGFTLVPNFSTTVDSATGQTLDAAIADLGHEMNPASQPAAMKGYIAMCHFSIVARLNFKKEKKTKMTKN